MKTAVIYSTVLLTRASAECVVKAEKSQLPTPRGGFLLPLAKEPNTLLSLVKSLSRHKPPFLV